MPSAEQQALVAAINEQPDDDTPRLIYADWLEESGDLNRAEFIRVQIAIAKLEHWDSEFLPLYVREKTLTKKCGKQWRSELPIIPGVEWGSFRRGMMATATIIESATLSTKADQAREHAPLEALTIGWPDSRRSFDDPAPIPGIRELHIHEAPYLGPEDISMLAWSPILGGIETLAIGDSNLGSDGVRRLLEGTGLAFLKRLRLFNNAIGNEGLDAILGAFAGLEELDLSEPDSYGRYEEDPAINADGMRALADWPQMKSLRRLAISGNAIGSEGLYALVQSEHLGNLKELVARNTDLSGSSMEAFTRANRDIKFEFIDVGENYITDVGAQFISLGESLDQLKGLRVDRCEIDRIGGLALADSAMVHSLTKLDCNDNLLGDEPVVALIERDPAQLSTLQLANNGLGRAAVEAIVKSDCGARLQALDLRGNRLVDDDVTPIFEAGALPGLLAMRLGSNRMNHPEKIVETDLGKRLLDAADYDPASAVPFFAPYDL